MMFGANKIRRNVVLQGVSSEPTSEDNRDMFTVCYLMGNLSKKFLSSHGGWCKAGKFGKRACWDLGKQVNGYKKMLPGSKKKMDTNREIDDMFRTGSSLVNPRAVFSRFLSLSCTEKSTSAEP